VLFAKTGQILGENVRKPETDFPTHKRCDESAKRLEFEHGREPNVQGETEFGCQSPRRATLWNLVLVFLRFLCVLL